MQKIEANGKTVEDAIRNGLKQLDASMSEVNIEVLDEGDRGSFIFGRGGRDAVVRIELKQGKRSEGRGAKGHVQIVQIEVLHKQRVKEQVLLRMLNMQDPNLRRQIFSKVSIQRKNRRPGLVRGEIERETLIEESGNHPSLQSLVKVQGVRNKKNI